MSQVSDNSPLPDDPPRDPNRLLSLSYFITIIGSGILMAQNWRRLGKPEWEQPTLILSIVLPIIDILLIGGFVALAVNNKSLIGFLFVGLALVFGLNFGFLFTVMWMQNPAYKKWKKEGVQAMLNHEYNLTNARRTYAIFMGISIIVGVVLSISFRNK